MKLMMWLRRNVVFIIFVLLTFGSMVYQYRTTKPTNYRELTEMERIGQLRRMNEYPPTAYRMANYLEKRPETVAYYKLEKNFVDVFDLVTLFTVYFPPLLLPFFLRGLFEAIKIYPKQVLLLTALPIALMTIIGQENTRGPVSLFPIIIFGSVFGMMHFINAVIKRNEN